MITSIIILIGIISTESEGPGIPANVPGVLTWNLQQLRGGNVLEDFQHSDVRLGFRV